MISEDTKNQLLSSIARALNHPAFVSQTFINISKSDAKEISDMFSDMFPNQYIGATGGVVKRGNSSEIEVEYFFDSTIEGNRNERFCNL